MKYRFAERMNSVPESFLGELFRMSGQPGIISFAGGLPDASLFDIHGLRTAAEMVLGEEAEEALQYSTTDGYLPLREDISRRYRERLGLVIDPDEIQIVNGSQQCLDLVAKILVNPGDCIGMERPGYLGAIEAFSFYQPLIRQVSLTGSGPDPDAFAHLIQNAHPVFFYGIPNSQNPAGITWSRERRQEIAEILDGSGTLLYEDDAFGELFFDASPRHPVKSLIPDQTILSGSFSKIIAPGMRIGWLSAPKQILSCFNAAKQAADLHSNFLSQKIMHQYLRMYDPTDHIRDVSAEYGRRCRMMEECIDDLCPFVHHTHPEGGMFMLLTLPDGISSMQIYQQGIREGVAVMPGSPFYTDGGGDNTLRLNFSNACADEIGEGIARLSRVLYDSVKPADR